MVETAQLMDDELWIFGPACKCGSPVATIDNGHELILYCTNPACCYAETKYRPTEVHEGDEDDDVDRPEDDGADW